MDRTGHNLMQIFHPMDKIIIIIIFLDVVLHTACSHAFAWRLMHV